MYTRGETEQAVRQRLFSQPLAREITLILVLKLVFLFGLWFAFFRHPEVPPVDGARVSEALLGAAGGSDSRADSRSEVTTHDS